MRSDKRKSASRKKRDDDTERPLQKSAGIVFVSLILLLILIGLAYLLFSTPVNEGEINKQRLLVSGIALLLLCAGLFVFLKSLYKKPHKKKKKSKIKKAKAVKK